VEIASSILGPTTVLFFPSSANLARAVEKFQSKLIVKRKPKKGCCDKMQKRRIYIMFEAEGGEEVSVHTQSRVSRAARGKKEQTKHEKSTRNVSVLPATLLPWDLPPKSFIELNSPELAALPLIATKIPPPSPRVPQQVSSPFTSKFVSEVRGGATKLLLVIHALLKNSKSLSGSAPTLVRIRKHSSNQN